MQIFDNGDDMCMHYVFSL